MTRREMMTLVIAAITAPMAVAADPDLREEVHFTRFKDLFYHIWSKRGLTDKQIEEKWKKLQRDRATKKRH